VSNTSGGSVGQTTSTRSALGGRALIVADRRASWAWPLLHPLLNDVALPYQGLSLRACDRDGLWQQPAMHVLAHATRFDAGDPGDLVDTDEVDVDRGAALRTRQSRRRLCSHGSSRSCGSPDGICHQDVDKLPSFRHRWMG
jgi:hypothetical protein